MERLSRYHKAGFGWLVSAAMHTLLLGALATVTLLENPPHSPVWIDTRLSREEAPGPVFKLVDGNESTYQPSREPAFGAVRSVAAYGSTTDPVPLDFKPVVATLSSHFPENPKELGLPVRLVNPGGRSSEGAKDPRANVERHGQENGRPVGFFGVEAQGDRFVYIVDASGSMRGERFQRACQELVRSVSELNPHQGFYVFFFNSTTFPLFYPATAPSLVPATIENKQRLVYWIGQARADGSTYPKTALFTALAMRPDVIFVLSDGKFPQRTVRRVKARNESGAVIHSIGFGRRAAEEVLKSLAEQNGGRYKFVP